MTHSWSKLISFEKSPYMLWIYSLFANRFPTHKFNVLNIFQKWFHIKAAINKTGHQNFLSSLEKEKETFIVCWLLIDSC